MITTRTRILSILATVAMLVSMFACFVIPASADESITAPYAALLEDVPGATNLAGVIESATEEATLSDALAVDVAAGNISWPTWAYGSVDYPRYAYKAVYTAAGYTDLVYSISEPADWTAMVTASTYDATNNATPETFAGYTFHVTKDVDFSGVASAETPMAPLSPGADSTYDTYQDNAINYPFNGTIQGHGNAFKNIYVQANVPGKVAKNYSFGLIAKLGPSARINEFGVDSGTITATGGSSTMKNLFVSTFGDPVTKGTGARLNKVWSGADINTGDCTVGSSYSKVAVGMLALGRDSTVEINGAYFFGTLDATGAKVGLFYDIKNGEDVYNSLCNTTTADTIINLNAATSVGNALNNYFVGSGDLFNVTPTKAVTTGSSTTAAASVEAAAYEINKLQSTSPVDGVDPVYYTITADGIRPTGDTNNQIVKVTVNGTVTKYVNKGTSLDEATLLSSDWANLESYTTLMVNGEAASLPLTAADGMEITITADAGAALEAKWEPYKLLNPTYLAVGADSAWTTASEAVSAVANATESDDKDGLITTANSAIDALKTALEENGGTYAVYPAADGKAIPGYELVDTYVDFNTSKTWAIGSTADWVKMVEDSDVEGDAQTFNGYKFHVLGNIDFAAVTDLKPLNFGNGKNDDATAPFQGTIEGHGYGFSNVNIEVSGTEETAYSVGLFGKLSRLATINDFGIDSGTIKGTGTASDMYVASFGEVLHTEDIDDKYTQLNNIWSGANIIADTTGTDNAMGLIGYSNGGGAQVNGAYFYGTLQAADRAIEIFFRLRHNESFKNVLSAATTVGTSTETGMYGVHSSPQGYTLTNNFGVNTTLPAADGADVAEPTKIVTNSASVGSDLEGAYNINKAQNAEDENAVYFAINENGKLRFADAGNIVKVTVNDGTSDKAGYFKAGTEVTKADLAEILGVPEAAVTAVKMGEDDATLPYAANADVTFTATIDYTVVMHDLWDDKYGQMDGKYLTTAAADKLAAVDAQVAAITTEQDLAKAAITAIGDLETVLVANGTYSTYPVTDDGKAVPGYKDVELYGAYNTANVWTINEAQDWIDMVRDSASNDFKGYVFHVTQDVDFDATPDNDESNVGIEMAPLNYGDEAAEGSANFPFNGTIQGYGHAFKNINVKKTINSDADTSTATGMIGKLGQYAVINNFGVDSGTINIDGTAGAIYVATFGEGVHKDAEGNSLADLATQHATLTKVWSNADITVAGTAAASGIETHSQYSYIAVNGAYFSGTLNAANGKYGISSNTNRSTYYNVLSDVAEADAMFVTNKSTTAMNNVYSVDPVAVEKTAGTFASITNQGKVDSALIGAYTINGKQPAATGVEEIYFTLNTNGDIRFGDATNKIVKVTVNSVDQYVNLGTTLNKAYFANLYGVDEQYITAITGSDSTDYTADGVAAADGLTLTVTLNNIGVLQAALADEIAKYAELDRNAFKTTTEIGVDGKIGVVDWYVLATSDTEANLQAAKDAIDNSTLVAEITTDYNRVPAFKDHAKYDAYQPANKNWKIVDKADWFEMDKEANKAEGSTYFANTTFHLTGDIDFEQDGSGDEYTDYMWPLGSSGTRAFAGTINGYGHGFENVYIKTIKNDANDPDNGYKTGYVNNHAGLFALLGAANIIDFGINSGNIVATTGTGTSNVSTFGAVNAATTVNFTRVWSGATLTANSANTHISALAGVYSGEDTKTVSTTSVVNVDGFTFYGTLYKEKVHGTGLNRNVAYGVFGGAGVGQADGSTFKNIISYPTNNSIEGVSTYLFGFTDETAFTTASANISNVYGIGSFTKTYRTGTDASTATDGTSETSWIHSDKTASAAAYLINTSGTNNGVYFTLVDGDVRPTSVATNEIVKVDVSGIDENVKTIYINANKAYTKAELEELLGVALTSVTAGTNATYAEDALTVTDDATITVVVNTCEHTGEKTCVHIADTKTHSVTCNDCGAVLDPVKCSGEWKYSTIDAATGRAYKYIDCETGCGGHYETDCTTELNEHPEDCTLPDEWVATCSHEHGGSVEAADQSNKKDEHDFSAAEWTNVAETNKQYKQCAHCTTKMYQIIGEVSTTGVELAPGAEDEFVITLPADLKSADLTIALTGGYTIKNVDGATLDGEVYKVSGVTTVTVYLNAAPTNATGGTITVTMTNALANDIDGAYGDVAITVAQATANITFTGLSGDANGDNTLTLGDALAVLYFVAGTSGEDSINKANVDLDENGNIEIADVRLIVEAWLKKTIDELQ